MSNDRGCVSHKVRPSKNTRRRAVVLVLVHVFIVLHVVQWLITGMTLSPVEPSEAMETLREGAVNTGFVFFVAALVSTLIFGRFFCGWACHVVALQDLSSHMMKRFRFRPKPWRTRLLVLMPIFLGLYMFVWPVFHRQVLTPYYPTVAGWFGLSRHMPIWMGRSHPLHGFTRSFIVEDFWATFPPWYVAIPFLLACGFGCVYFLGAKGFCTYACPYGGFFGPIDKLSVGRIVVNDNCEQCGHCTAVCTSNVRVHEEVRDFGAVVDAGCMKCLDCVSVCPNNALSFRFAKPAVLTKARNADNRVLRRKNRSHLYDLTPGEEIVFLALFLYYIFAFRGIFNMVPLLMAGGVASIAAFLTWKLWQTVRVQNVRLHRWQLRRRGRFTRSSTLFGAIVLVVIASSVWSSLVKYHRWQFGLIDASLEVTAEQVFAQPYVPTEVVRNNAMRAIAHATRAAPIAEGGMGWAWKPGERVRLAWMYCVAGDFFEAETQLVDAALAGNADMELIESVLLTMRARGATDAERQHAIAKIGARNPHLIQLQVLLAQSDVRAGRVEHALVRLRSVLSERNSDIASVGPAAQLMVQLGQISEATAMLEKIVEQSPRKPDVRFLYGTVLAAQQRFEEAVRQLEIAVELQSENVVFWETLAALYDAVGDTDRAQLAANQVRKLANSPTSRQHPRTP